MKKGLIGKVWTADSVLRRDRNKDYEVGLLNNPRHERFARLVATGERPARAYAAVTKKKPTVRKNSVSKPELFTLR
jgi:hypothetical protein